MRKLNVKRKWSICECASKINLYIQCPEEYATHNIDGKNFREYRLKNGKTVTADIFDEETKIYIESSTMQVSYTIEAGTEDINLLAKPHYNPMQGNPFTIEKM